MEPSNSLVEILASAGIRLRSMAPGHTEAVRCPRCDGGRTREISLSVTIDEDGEGAVFSCHRGGCGWQDGARVHRSSPAPRHDRVIQKPRPDPESVATHRPDWLYEFFADRKIGARVVNLFGVYATVRKFGDLGERPTIVFPYRLGGELVNRKYRPHPQKQPQQQDKDALQTLFNVDALGIDPVEIVFVEGEPDCMAMAECGIVAVSVKDGAPAKVSEKPEVNDKRFEALRTHADVLKSVKRIVLAGDMDVPGLALREELARRLGRHRCYFVEWPEGCKDACDVLRQLGPDAVTAALEAAEPYPMEGLQRITPGMLRNLRKQPAPSTMTTGTRGTDGILHLPTEGRLIIVTGWPSHGKTNWTRFVMIHTAGQHNRRWGVFSPEMQPWGMFVAECAQVWIGKLFWPSQGLPNMSDQEIDEAENWLRNRVTMLVCDAEAKAPTLDWIIDHAVAAVLRDGVTDLLIDPWNEVEQVRGQMTETDYIGHGLQRLKAFALRYGCNVWIVAHPAKPPPLRPGEKRGAPGPYDLAGSAHWANRSDLGITIHSPNTGQSELHVWKARFRRLGKRGTVALMEFDELHGRYSDPISAPPDPIPLPKDWRDGMDS